MSSQSSISQFTVASQPVVKKTRGPGKQTTTTTGAIVTAKSFPDSLLSALKGVLRAHPVLWDAGLPIAQRDAQTKQAAWTQVSAQLNMDKQIVQAKVKSIQSQVSQSCFVLF